jgi:hypothetical protein
VPPCSPNLVSSFADLSRAGRCRVVRTIETWERREYGPAQARAAAAIRARTRRHPAGLLCVFDRGRLAGYTEVLPLTPAAYGRLRRGDIREEAMPARWVSSGASPRRSWYVGSLVVERALRSERSERARARSVALQRALWRHVRDAGLPPVRVLGIAATGVGPVMFRNTGFEPVASGPAAVDLRPRFEQLLRSRADIDARCDATESKVAESTG